VEDPNLSDVPVEHIEKASFLDKLIATGLGAGLSPLAPGTIGSVIGLIVYFIPGFETSYIIIPAIVLFFFWGSSAAGRMEKEYGHDPSRVVIDEVVGMWVSLVFIPKTLFLTAITFLVFRMLDIFKPFPANYFDKKTGGIYIMLDDFVCGVFANILMQVYLHLFK
jgi:phosphatidylglycerophosphatase A